MGIEVFLSISSFSISVGGLVASLFLPNRRSAALTIVVSALIATSSVTLSQHYERKEQINRVEKELISLLEERSLTFDELIEEMLFDNFETTYAALLQAKQNGLIGHRMEELQIGNEIIRVRMYYVSQK